MKGVFEIWTVLANHAGSFVPLTTFQATRMTAEEEVMEWSHNFPSAVLILRTYGRTVASYKAGKALPKAPEQGPWYPRPINVQFTIPHDVHSEILKVAREHDLPVKSVLGRSIALGVGLVANAERVAKDAQPQDWNTDGDVPSDKLTGGAG